MKLDHVTAVVHALNSAGVRYLIVGGLAVNAHGHVRYTNDLDLVIGLEPANSSPMRNCAINGESKRT